MKKITELKLTNHENVVFDNMHAGFTTACNPRNYTYTVHSDYSNEELEEIRKVIIAAFDTEVN